MYKIIWDDNEMYKIKVIKHTPDTLFQFSHDGTHLQLNVHNASHCSFSFSETNSIVIPPHSS
jgi:hypothetical protein